MPDQLERWLPCAFLNAFKFMHRLSGTLCGVYHHSTTRDGAVYGIWAHVEKQLPIFDLPRSVFRRIQHFWPGITVAWWARHYLTSSVERISIVMPLSPSSGRSRILRNWSKMPFGTWAVPTHSEPAGTPHAYPGQITQCEASNLAIHELGASLLRTHQSFEIRWYLGPEILFF